MADHRRVVSESLAASESAREVLVSGDSCQRWHLGVGLGRLGWGSAILTWVLDPNDPLGHSHATPIPADDQLALRGAAELVARTLLRKALPRTALCAHPARVLAVGARLGRRAPGGSPEERTGEQH